MRCCAKETRSNWCKRRFLPNVLAVEESGILMSFHVLQQDFTIQGS
jgi:hypothetical protein